MKLCILGATGNSGRRLTSRALELGHDVTAVVRSVARAGDLRHANLTLTEVDYASHTALRDVMRPHDVVINAAGTLGDTVHFAPLVERIIRAAEAALGPGGRFWMFAGAALLDVPGTSIVTLSLPGVPRIFDGHRINYRAIRGSQLDWSILCPGPMIASPNARATDGLIVSEEIWPVPRRAYTNLLPRLALSVAFRQAVPRLTIYYEDAAKVVLDNLGKNGPFSRRRVGVALPVGEARHKPNYSTRPAPPEANRRV